MNRGETFVLVVSTCFIALALKFYFADDIVRANYWLITTLMVETIYMRLAKSFR